MLLVEPNQWSRHGAWELLIKIICTVLFIFWHPLMAQSYKFSQVNHGKGLFQYQIESIHLDASGFMWFGTHSGLYRYDGYDYLAFKSNPDNPYSISNSSVNSIKEDHSGNIWIGTNRGLSLFEPKYHYFRKFTTHDGTSIDSHHVLSIHVTRKNMVLIGTKSGTKAFNPENGVLTHLDYQIKDTLEVDQDSVLDIIEDCNGFYWIGTQSYLIKYNPKTEKAKRYLDYENKSLKHVLSIREDHSNNLWIAGSRGLHYYNSKSDQIINYNFDSTKTQTSFPKRVNDLFIRSNGSIWVATESAGLLLFDPAEKIFLKVPVQTQGRQEAGPISISQVFEEPNGNLWVGTKQGLFKSHSASSIFLRERLVNKDNTNREGVTAIHKDNHGTLWYGTLGNGLWRQRYGASFEQFNNEPDNPNTPGHNRIFSIKSKSEDELWLGTQAGLDLLNTKTGKYLHFYPAIGTEQYGFDFVFSLGKGSSNSLWLGTFGGLCRFDGNSFEYFFHNPDDPNSLSGQKIWSVLETADGTVWAGSLVSGLNRRHPSQPGTFQRLIHEPGNPNSLIHDEVRHIYEDHERMIWIATAGGLDRYNPQTEQFTHYRKENGLPSDAIASIVEDNKTNIWVSTSKGLARLDRYTGKIKTFDESDGTLDSNFSFGANLSSKAGKLYFGGIKGVTSFFPAQIKDDPTIPPIVLTEFNLFGKPAPFGPDNPDAILTRAIDQTDEISLPHDDNMFSIKFAALHYAIPKRNRYAYKLDGVDRDWVYTDASNRLATYTKLDAGAYTFHVKGSNHDGYWNEAGKTLKIKILPPLWLTWWAKCFYALAGLGLLALIITLITRRRTLEYERSVNRELRRLDKLKDDFLAATSHELRTPLQGIIGLAESMVDSPETRSQDMTANLAVIAGSGKRLANLVEHIQDHAKLENHGLTLNPKAVDIHAQINLVLALVSPMARQKKLTLVNDVNPQAPTVLADEERIQQILHNLIGNAVKFTDFGAIELSAEWSAKTMTVRVKDSGIGISAEDQARIFEPYVQGSHEGFGGTGLGLALTNRLVELHGGDLSVDAVPGQGSIFSFSLPLAHEPARETTASIRISPLPEITEPEATGNGAAILVVDDEEINRMVIGNFLRPHDYQITLAHDGVEALELLEKEQFDLVLMDVMMPGLSGYEVCREIRIRYDMHQLPVILLTARNREEDQLAGFDSGANDYLVKPISKSEILARVRVHLELLAINRNLEERVDERTRAFRSFQERKNRFFIDISHQIRTPLTLIKGPLDELRTEQGDSRLERMAQQVQNLRRLMDQLLDISKLEAGKMLPKPTHLDLASFVRRRVAAFDDWARQDNIALITDGMDAPMVATLDPEQLGKILDNLLSNALRHTEPHGKIMVTLTKAWDQIMLTVKDTGKGISAEHLPHLFDRFYQVETGGGGSGIGLSLSRELARLNGGDIQVTSKPGFGSEFAVNIPQTRMKKTETSNTPAVPQHEMIKQIAASGPDKSPPGAPKILVVEDHSDFRAYLREQLEAHYRVLEAGNGEKGLELVNIHHPDLIISDLNMPHMDGSELCRHVKQSDKTADIPIIILSVSTEKRLKGLEQGADDYLAKPFEIKELLTRVANLIQSRRMLRNHYHGLLVQPGQIEVTSEEQRFMIRVRETIEENIENPNFGVHELAEELGISPRQLRRRFKDLLDLSPGDFLRNFRLEFAAHLLEAKAGSVAEIAYRAGYRKPTYFSKLFRSKYGHAPSEHYMLVTESTGTRQVTGQSDQ